ncbi:hypothetical protein RF11_01911 [Thelohanellus kitauei]|uniref:Uncharacterized protein n=1 Tax=Thelohanellus kitauei TaxID=669202 RepID=A0A0C2MQT0_THEKT|nr:hypothetical protein RF11_01911 [Thelohanellus kitauei]
MSDLNFKYFDSDLDFDEWLDDCEIIATANPWDKKRRQMKSGDTLEFIRKVGICDIGPMMISQRLCSLSHAPLKKKTSREGKATRDTILMTQKVNYLKNLTGSLKISIVLSLENEVGTTSSSPNVTLDET